MPRFRIVAAGALAIAAGAAPRAMAAPDDGLPAPLRMEQALQRALDRNLTIRQARQQVGILRGRREHAARIVPTNPELALSAGRRSRGSEATTDIGVRISQTLFTGGKRGLHIAVAEARTGSARARLEYLQTATVARTRRAFLDLLVAKEAVTTAEEVLESARAFHEYARQRLEAGEATRLAVNTARIGSGRARAALAAARTEVSRTRVRLLQLLAADPARELRVAGNLTTRPLDLPDREKLLRRALERRSDLAAAGRQVAAARKALKLSERQLIPNLTVYGFYKREEGADVAGGGLSAPIPVLHRYGGEQRAARARLQQARLEEDTLRLTVRREVTRALAAYEGARQRVKALKGTVLESAAENLELVQRALKAGNVGAPAVTTARDNLLNVRRDYLDALRSLVEAGTTLERATGGLIALGPRPGTTAATEQETESHAR
ncbi:TolC family protein [Thiohalorhabdus sp. Cl-TMA]|uniref:TolC family protein n=1 Tax=Thiohalorhabdus methylotrophus TaxID=3242694 RepID=A0ABV4TSL6_9GAMM